MPPQLPLCAQAATACALGTRRRSCGVRAKRRCTPRAARRAPRCVASALVPHDDGSAADNEPAAPPLTPSQTASVQLPRARRRTQLDFTCNRCGERSSRLVNPEALTRGTVFVQCATASCAVWHKITDSHNFYGVEYTNLQQDIAKDE